MPSPFPGMDPYLEALWGDVHASFIPTLREAINARLPAGYFAGVELFVWFRADGEGPARRVKPDVAVALDATAAVAVATATATAAVAAPWEVELPEPEDEAEQLYLEITHLDARRVVTAVELLSPENNEVGPGRTQYLTERRRYRQAGVHLVEIDLLRAGPRLPMAGPPPRSFDYAVTVARADRRPRAAFWPLTVRDPLPTVAVPLAAGDTDLMLPLQPVLDAVYDRAGYHRVIDYARPPVPPLAAADAAWASDRLAARPAEGR